MSSPPKMSALLVLVAQCYRTKQANITLRDLMHGKAACVLRGKGYKLPDLRSKKDFELSWVRCII